MVIARHLPTEWARQAGIMLAWPHAQTDWFSALEAVERTYVNITREIAARETLLIVCCDDAELARVRERLRFEGIDLNRVRFAVAPFDDTWVRDYGPITVLTGRKPKLLDFRFNAWGGKYSASRDDAVTRTLHGAGAFGEVEIESLPLVLEGGSIEVDGAGSLLTTSHCLLAPTRNPELDRPALELRLETLFGVERVLWLEHGYVAGDDTDSHIDMLARFCNADTIAYACCENPADEHYQPLKAMAAELESFRTFSGAPYRLVPLPIPKPIRNHKGQRLPASYANFLIVNDAVLLPIYNDPADQVAIARLKPVSPARSIVAVDCTALIQQYGNLHCMTMQLPEGVDLNDASGAGSTRE